VVVNAPAGVVAPGQLAPEGSPGTAVDLAYQRCEQITRREARNFAYGIRLLPAEKRRAMSALYAFARRVDDIGDGAGDPQDKLLALAAVRGEIDALASGKAVAGDPVLVALADTLDRYPLPVGALHELVTGCEMDCATQHYETIDELTVYCRCVAGSIGRLSLAIFGSPEAEASRLADVLGIALQLTNILRDVAEDRDVMGRLYLPAEDLTRFGCEPDASGPLERLADLVRFESGRARAHYMEGLQLLELLDRRSRACVAAMAGIYLRLLGRIERDPLAVLHRRVSLPAWEKAWVAARSLAGAGA
jgi:phytoene synthase